MGKPGFEFPICKGQLNKFLDPSVWSRRH